MTITADLTHCPDTILDDCDVMERLDLEDTLRQELDAQPASDTLDDPDEVDSIAL